MATLNFEKETVLRIAGPELFVQTGLEPLDTANLEAVQGGSVLSAIVSGIASAIGSAIVSGAASALSSAIFGTGATAGPGGAGSAISGASASLAASAVWGDKFEESD